MLIEYRVNYMLEVQKHLLLSRELSFIRYRPEYCEYSCMYIGETYKNNWGFEIVVFLQRSDGEGQRNGELCTRTGNLWYIEMSSLATTNKHISLVFKCIWKCRCILKQHISRKWKFRHWKRYDKESQGLGSIALDITDTLRCHLPQFQTNEFIHLTNTNGETFVIEWSISLVPKALGTYMDSY